MTCGEGGRLRGPQAAPPAHGPQSSLQKEIANETSKCQKFCIDLRGKVSGLGFACLGLNWFQLLLAVIVSQPGHYCLNLF